MMAVAMGRVRADAAILARNVVWPCAVGRQGQGGSTGRAIRCGRPAGKGVQLEVQCTATRGHPGDRGATPEKARQKGGLAEENKRERGSLDGAGAESESDGTARHGARGGRGAASDEWYLDSRPGTPARQGNASQNRSPFNAALASPALQVCGFSGRLWRINQTITLTPHPSKSIIPSPGARGLALGACTRAVTRCAGGSM